MEAIEWEFKKFINFSLVSEKQHPDWVAIPVLKKKGKIQICIDIRDLNVACPKDEFPLLITDIMIDNTCEFEECLSWTTS